MILPLTKKGKVIYHICGKNLLEEVKTHHNALQMTTNQDKKFEVHFIELERFSKSV
jgi:hypothetical protein